MSIHSPQQFEKMRACGMIVGKASRDGGRSAAADRGDVSLDKDGWTYRTADGSLSVH
jgi:hypothetical protein